MEETLRNILAGCTVLGGIFLIFGLFGVMLGPTPASPNNREAGAWSLLIGVVLIGIALSLGLYLGPTS